MLHKRKKIFEGALVKCGPFVSCFGSIADPAERCSQMSTVKLVFKPIQIHIIHFCSYSKRLTSSSAVFLFTPPLSIFVDFHVTIQLQEVCVHLVSKNPAKCFLPLFFSSVIPVSQTPA